MELPHGGNASVNPGHHNGSGFGLHSFLGTHTVRHLTAADGKSVDKMGQEPGT